MAQETISEEVSPASSVLVARGLAAARALESERVNPIFVDPYARLFAGPEGLSGIIESQAMLPKRATDLLLGALAIRTRYFDDALVSAVTGGIRQVVAVGAGFDSRAFRLPLGPEVKFWEIDQSEIFDAKEPLLEEAGAEAVCDRIVLRFDIHDDWEVDLLASGFIRSEPTAFLVEGVLAYQIPEGAHDLLDRVTALAAVGSWLGFDVLGKSLLNFGPFQRHREWLAGKGSPFLFSSDDPEVLAISRGWSARSAVPGEKDADYGRWPFPAFPRAIPGIPRNYYVSATKR